MDKDPAEEGEDARGVLASWLDDYIGGRCDRADMQASFLSVCRSNPDAPWDALALLDQYQRRGRIDTALARTLKAEIAQLVFGVANQTEAPRDATEAALDTTGSRWRKLYAERHPGSINADESFADPTLFRRDADPLIRDPLTRPPQTGRVSAAQAAEHSAPTGGVLRDRYELLSLLGRGGAGSVYKAMDRHRAHLTESARCVAVKVLKLDYQDRPEALAALEQEFHQARSLSHPNIVSVFDLDRDGSTYFLVMELLEGELLADLLRRMDGRAMTRDHALNIVSSVGAALAHAHRRNVVHGDLKPRNVMITTDGEVRVLDFGFAQHRAVEPQIGESAGPLLSSAAAPAYASVERANGAPPHQSDDVYGLACLAYELLSGRHPFGGRSALLAKAHGRPAERISGLSGKQWHALSRALQWTRSERDIDVVELLAALGCSGAAQRLGSPGNIVMDRGRGSRSLGNVAAVLLLVAAGVAAAFYFLRTPDSQSERAARIDALPVPQTAVPEVAPEPPPQTAPETSQLEAAERESAQAQSAQPQPARSKEPAAAAPIIEKQPEAPQVAVPPARKPAAAAGAAAAGRAATMIQFDKDTYVATESDAAVRLVVKRTGPTSQPVSFRWSLKGNSAEAGEDFAAIGPVSEQIPAGSRSLNVTIPLVSDAVSENTELFLVELQQVQEGAQLGELSHAAVIIVDDD